MSFDWVQRYLINPPQPFVSQLYPFAAGGIPQPVYVPEQRDGRWWKRTHLVIPIYEQVNEETTLPAAQGVAINLTTDTGITRTITVEE